MDLECHPEPRKNCPDTPSPPSGQRNRSCCQADMSSPVRGRIWSQRRCSQDVSVGRAEGDHGVIPRRHSSPATKNWLHYLGKFYLPPAISVRCSGPPSSREGALLPHHDFSAPTLCAFGQSMPHSSLGWMVTASCCRSVPLVISVGFLVQII